jgi:hypothetical protein
VKSATSTTAMSTTATAMSTTAAVPGESIGGER